MSLGTPGEPGELRVRLPGPFQLPLFFGRVTVDGEPYFPVVLGPSFIMSKLENSEPRILPNF